MINKGLVEKMLFIIITYSVCIMQVKINYIHMFYQFFDSFA